MSGLRFSFLLAIYLAFAASSLAQSSAIPEGWKQVTRCHFTFLVPQETKESNTSPVDSCLASFDYKDISFHLDYGWYSAPLSKQEWMREYRNETVTINGRQAEVSSYTDAMFPDKISYVSNVHIVTEKNSKSPMVVSLLMTFEAYKPLNLQITKRIYESLKFVGK